MTSLVEALENLLATIPPHCGVMYDDEKCSLCAALTKMRTEAQAALDAVPVLEWTPRPVGDPEYSAYAEIGTLFLLASNGGWWELRSEGGHCSVCDDSDVLIAYGSAKEKTLEVAKAEIENAVREMGIVFRTVRK